MDIYKIANNALHFIAEANNPSNRNEVAKKLYTGFLKAFEKTDGDILAALKFFREKESIENKLRNDIRLILERVSQDETKIEAGVEASIRSIKELGDTNLLNFIWKAIGTLSIKDTDKIFEEWKIDEKKFAKLCVANLEKNRLSLINTLENHNLSYEAIEGATNFIIINNFDPEQTRGNPGPGSRRENITMLNMFNEFIQYRAGKEAITQLYTKLKSVSGDIDKALDDVMTEFGLIMPEKTEDDNSVTSGAKAIFRGANYVADNKNYKNTKMAKEAVITWMILFPFLLVMMHSISDDSEDKPEKPKKGEKTETGAVDNTAFSNEEIYNVYAASYTEMTDIIKIGTKMIQKFRYNLGKKYASLSSALESKEEYVKLLKKIITQNPSFNSKLLTDFDNGDVINKYEMRHSLQTIRNGLNINKLNKNINAISSKLSEYNTVVQIIRKIFLAQGIKKSRSAKLGQKIGTMIHKTKTFADEAKNEVRG